MFNAGFQTFDDIKRAPIEELTNLPMFGPRLAKKIKEQVYPKKGKTSKRRGFAS
jgi:hypothetical protein